jgi:hypothetical protein
MTDSRTPLDPITMARFLVMPGAVEALTALSRIPPGPLRESAIHHLEVMAQTYEAAPASTRMPDPLAAAAQVSARETVPKLDAPADRTGRKPKDREEQIIALRRQRKTVSEIKELTHASRATVEKVIAEARKGGLRFPQLPEETKVVSFPISMDEISSKQRAAMERAAFSRGLILQQYIAARALFVEERKKGRPMSEIAKLTRVDERTIWQWYYAARNAGIDFPRDEIQDAEIEPVRLFPRFEDLKGHARSGALSAAKQRGTTPQAYCDMYNEVMVRTVAGDGPGAIAEAIGEPPVVIKSILYRERKLGRLDARARAPNPVKLRVV